MQRLLFSAILVFTGGGFCVAADFEPPVRLKAGDAAIRVESPGYAAPCWADLNGDGKTSGSLYPLAFMFAAVESSGRASARRKIFGPLVIVSWFCGGEPLMRNTMRTRPGMFLNSPRIHTGPA